jgi:hypothetical protein
MSEKRENYWTRGCFVGERTARILSRVGVHSGDESSGEERAAKAIERNADTAHEVGPTKSDGSAHAADGTAEPSTANT